MKTFLYLCALLLTLAGCRTTKPDRAAGTDPTGPYVPVVVRPDTTKTASLDSAQVVPHRSLVDKLLGRTPQADTYVGQSTIKAGKKSTINAYYAPATVTSTTTGKKGQSTIGAGATSTKVEKPKGPTSTGSGDATAQTRTQASSTIKGDNNAPKLTNTAPEAPGIGATIASNLTKPLGVVVALAVVGLFAYGCWRYKNRV